jgi:AAA+ ATPase superfamily predicted ATPase
MKPPINPFVISGYHGPDWFCDRLPETRLLLSHIKNGNNVTLFALRRLGKTGLIHHVFHHLAASKKTACIYVDIFSTKSLREFTNQLATAVYNRFPEKKGIGQRFFSLLKLLRPVISYDALTGNPEVSLDLAMPKDYERTIQQILSFLESQPVKTVIAIDEFQQITTYPEKNTEAILRTYIQPLKNCSFIFCGSNQKIMSEIFNNAKGPFYGSCLNVALSFIDEKEYAGFIEKLFRQFKKNIDKEATAYILSFTERHTYYTQLLCNQIFAGGEKNITIETVLSACADLLVQQESNFYQFRNLLTQTQWQLLTAIAKETKVQKPYSSEFIKKYQLGTPSMVTRTLESLLAKEMIYYNSGIKEPYYAVYDKFLMRWLQ